MQKQRFYKKSNQLVIHQQFNHYLFNFSIKYNGFLISYSCSQYLYTNTQMKYLNRLLSNLLGGYETKNTEQTEEISGYTNNVLFDGNKTYYVPGYLRIKLINFFGIDFETLEATARVTIIFTIYHKELNKQLVQQLMDGMVINFSRDDSISLNSKNENKEINLSKNSEMFTYTIRKKLNFRIQSSIFWSPFEIINLYLTIDIKTISVITAANKKAQIKVNLMEHHNSWLKQSISQDVNFVNYNLAESLMTSEYTKQRIPRHMREKDMKRKYAIQNNREAGQGIVHTIQTLQTQNQSEQSPLKRKSIQQIIQIQEKKNQQKQKKKKKKSQEISNYKYAHFNFPIYKFPKTALAKVFLPYWLLALLSVGVFFQDNVLGERFTTISTLMIAFISMIPIVRKQIPPNPTITFVQWLIVASACTTLLGFFDSIQVDGIQDYQFIWFLNWKFLFSIIINISTCLIVVTMYLKHIYAWQISYNNRKENNIDFVPAQWFNQKCDIDFLSQWPRIKKYKN